MHTPPVPSQTTIQGGPFANGGFGLSTDDASVLDQRWDRWGADLIDGLSAVYPAKTVVGVQKVIAAGFASRSAKLRDRDTARLLRPDWYQQPDMIGYAAYTDRFAGTFKGLEERVDYLQDLGVTYLHLMPLLQPRIGPNDGGYAVADYRKTRSDLGTMDELAALADELHSHGISLTLDLVLNHVADQHEWAERARKGEARYRDYFYLFEDRTVPDQYEKSLPEIFPTFAPGNFTWDDDLKSWVWTTFNSWQWDLNWTNPAVFCEMLDIILYLANRGADCLRLDAIAFIWKKLGTDSQNQPEVHALTQALRAAAHIAAPALILKAEAIVGPNQLVNYLGQGKHAGKVSEIAYHNSLMVQIWSAFASQDARLMATALSRFPSVPRLLRGEPMFAVTMTSVGQSMTPMHPHSALMEQITAGSFLTSTSGTSPVLSREVRHSSRTNSPVIDASAEAVRACSASNGHLPTRIHSRWILPSSASDVLMPPSTLSVGFRCSIWVTSWVCSMTTASARLLSMLMTTVGCTVR